MYQEKRPTCVTVIGWVWIIFGGLMLFSSFMALFAFSTMGDVPQDQNIPIIFKFFPLLAALQMMVAMSGLISGINFLKLKAWSRLILEILTWLILLTFVGFGIFAVTTGMTGPSEHYNFGISVFELIIIFGIISFYVVPFGIILKYLRGQKVKTAMVGSV